MRSLAMPDGLIRVVFATIVMGMGVNFSDINLVIHYGAPQSLDDYFQESGRCGRSGENAKSVVYWKPSECPSRKEIKTTRDAELMAVRRYLEKTSECRRKWLSAYFDPGHAHTSKEPTHCCDACFNEIIFCWCSVYLNNKVCACIGQSKSLSESEPVDSSLSLSPHSFTASLNFTKSTFFLFNPFSCALHVPRPQRIT